MIDRNPELQRQFTKLAEIWQDETKYSSFLNVSTKHPAFREIVQLREPVVPYILDRIIQKPDWTILAIPIITGEWPNTRPQSRGRLPLLTEDTLKWGYRRGYLPLVG
jgi:hypothetical protein